MLNVRTEWSYEIHVYFSQDFMEMEIWEDIYFLLCNKCLEYTKSDRLPWADLEQ